MKKVIIILSIVVGLGFAMVGCSDYLDSDYLATERLNIEAVFNNKDYTNSWLARGYSFLGSNYLQDVASKKNVPFNFADDMYFDGENNRYRNWKAGRYSETGLNGESKGIWENAYNGIRQVSVFVDNIDNSTVFNKRERDDMKAQAHFLRAYFYWILIRTYGPVPIVPEHGIDYTKEYDEIAQPRNTYDECVNYITDELVQAARMLPFERGAEDVTRPTQGAALALRAKVLLYAASPLYNGKAPVDVSSAMVDKKGRHLLPDTYDESKWAKAAAAAKDVMDLNVYKLNIVYKRTETVEPLAYPVTIIPPYDANFSGKNWPEGWNDIDPFESYRSMFNGTVPAYENKELIFTRGQNGSVENLAVMVEHQLPRSYGKGYNSHCMTQKQCDAYYMNDGTDCPGMNDIYADKSAYVGRYNTLPRAAGYVATAEIVDYPELGPQGTNVSKQYAKREPRFYASVAYNGSTWNLLNANTGGQVDEVKNIQVFYYLGEANGYKGGTSGSTGNYSSITGIGIKKYVHPDDISLIANQYETGRIQKKVDPAIRYAEILLIYAEALNELTTSYSIPSWDGNVTHAISRNEAEMKKGIQPVRIRAGVPDYTTEVYGNADMFRTKLKRERQIELFAEGQRYFDLRRWGDAPNEESLPIYGCNIYSSKNQREIFHTPVICPSLAPIFSPKMWFWPIHHDELKRNKELTQNPGWTDPE